MAQLQLSASGIAIRPGPVAAPRLPGIDLPELPPVRTRFTVLIDSQEQQPFTFEGFRCDSSRSHRQIEVATEIRRLGSWTQEPDEAGTIQTVYRSLADYSIGGFVGAVGIERKSLDDFHGTVLGWGVRRDRFIRELESLNQFQFAAVVVESSLQAALDSAPCWGIKSADENRASLFGSVQSWQQRFPRVHWIFCDSRRLAEETTFHHLRRFWARKVSEGRRIYGARFMRGGIL